MPKNKLSIPISIAYYRMPNTINKHMATPTMSLHRPKHTQTTNKRTQ